MLMVEPQMWAQSYKWREAVRIAVTRPPSHPSRGKSLCMGDTKIMWGCNNEWADSGDTICPDIACLVCFLPPDSRLEFSSKNQVPDPVPGIYNIFSAEIGTSDCLSRCSLTLSDEALYTAESK